MVVRHGLAPGSGAGVTLGYANPARFGVHFPLLPLFLFAKKKPFNRIPACPKPALGRLLQRLPPIPGDAPTRDGAVEAVWG